MLTYNMLYAVLAGTIIGLWLIYIFVCYPYKAMLKAHKKVLMSLMLSAVIINFGLVNQVYITDDDNQVERYALLFPTYQRLNNNTLIYLYPKFGLSNAWVVNNGQRPVVFETVIYGTSNQQIAITNIAAYTISRTRAVEFIFQPPPRNIQIKRASEIKGWLHR